ncbi:MAG TPA: arginine deiminase family protein [Myxococcota bacterium]|nr:arginine deiminase family protein [Myxococcota bacterium]
MRALVRPPSLAFVDALGQVEGHAPIDLQLALRQHADYAEALGRVGCELVALPSDDDLPDACFVEDTAIVLGECALITRPGAPSRRPEVLAVAAALASHGLTLTMMEAPATLDGGDVLVLGRTVWVGLSNRTNREGLEALGAFARGLGYDTRVANVPPGTLHLKCHASPLDPETLLCAPGLLTEAVARRVEVPAHEAYAANAIAIGRSVLCAAGFPGTHERLAAAGFEPVPLANSEFAKADGSLTCLSILWG